MRTEKVEEKVEKGERGVRMKARFWYGKKKAEDERDKKKKKKGIQIKK